MIGFVKKKSMGEIINSRMMFEWNFKVFGEINKVK